MGRYQRRRARPACVEPFAERKAAAQRAGQAPPAAGAWAQGPQKVSEAIPVGQPPGHPAGPAPGAGRVNQGGNFMADFKSLYDLVWGATPPPGAPEAAARADAAAASPTPPTTGAGAPPESPTPKGGLQAKVARLEEMNEQLGSALWEVKQREEDAERFAAEARAREEALARRLAALEERLGEGFR